MFNFRAWLAPIPVPADSKIVDVYIIDVLFRDGEEFRYAVQSMHEMVGEDTVELGSGASLIHPYIGWELQAPRSEELFCLLRSKGASIPLFIEPGDIRAVSLVEYFKFDIGEPYGEEEEENS